MAISDDFLFRVAARISGPLRRRVPTRIAHRLQKVVPFVFEAPQLYWNLHQPQEYRLETHGPLYVEGWACAVWGIRSVDCYLNDQLVSRLHPHQQRPDIAALHPDVFQAEYSGFAQLLQLDQFSAGDYMLRCVFRDRAGLVATTMRSLRLTPVPTEQHPDQIYWGLSEPGQHAFETKDGAITVYGWAFAAAGLARIDAYLDGEYLQSIRQNQQRPDVAKTFADVPDAMNSGFYTTIPLTPAQQRGSVFLLAFTDRLGNCAVVRRLVGPAAADLHYQRYYLRSLPPTSDRLAAQQQLKNTPATAPFFIWWLVADDRPGLPQTLWSLQQQDYTAWHCYILAPDKSAWSAVTATLEAVVGADWSRHYTLVQDLVMQHHDHPAPAYVGFMAVGEALVASALWRWAAALQARPADLSYADHDQMKGVRSRCQPHFKPDWSPDYALARNYIGGMYLVRHSQALVVAIAALPEQPNFDVWRYALWLALTETTDQIHHFPQVLWSEPYRETVDAVTAQGEVAVVQAALAQRQIDATVEPIGSGLTRRIQRPLPEVPPLVSIIIPTTGRLTLVKTCVESLTANTTYPAYEFIFLDNGRGQHPDGIAYLRDQGIQVIERHEPFNWARLNNAGAAAANGELLLFLNDDIEVTQGDWLSELVAQVTRPEVGAVGAMLLYPDGRIQHAGVFLTDYGGGAQHYLQFMHPAADIYQSIHTVVREVASNTGACLIMRRSVFEAVQGFDEDLAIVGNDTDMCLRIGAAGYRNLWTPFAELVHHESISRKNIPFDTDESKLWQRWHNTFLTGDRYYNPNFSNIRTDFSFRVNPHDNAGTSRHHASDRPLAFNVQILSPAPTPPAVQSLGQALKAVKIPVQLIADNTQYHDFAQTDFPQIAPISEPQHTINLLYIGPHETPDTVVARLPDSYFVGRRTIGYWDWHWHDSPQEWLFSFAYLDELWVPSTFARAAIAGRSPVPVAVVPAAIAPTVSPATEREHWQLPPHAFLFLTATDGHDTLDYGHVQRAVTAFEQAFPGDRADVGLAVWASNVSPSMHIQIQTLVASRDHVYLISHATLEDLPAVMSQCDCLLSLHQVQSSGRAIAQAMALGLPVIATDWSANTDWMTPYNAACVDYALTQGPHPNCRWAEPDLASAADWLQRLVSDRSLAQHLGQQAQQDSVRLLSPAAIGQQVRARLTELCS